MPISQIFTVVGDANVRRNMTAMNIASRPSMSTAKVVDCDAAVNLVPALASVSEDTTVCIVQCITSFLVSAPVY